MKTNPITIIVVGVVITIIGLGILGYAYLGKIEKTVEKADHVVVAADSLVEKTEHINVDSFTNKVDTVGYRARRLIDDLKKQGHDFAPK